MNDHPLGLSPVSFNALLRAFPWILTARVDSVLPGDLMKVILCGCRERKCLEYIGENPAHPQRRVKIILSNN